MTPAGGWARDRLAAGSGGRLVERLVAVVRPEFRVEVYVPDPADPVFGFGFCAVGGCGAPAAERGLCGGHYIRWRKTGRPEMAGFLADPGPAVVGRSSPACCTVGGCRFGVGGRGLCPAHLWQWRRSGQPDPARWAATAEAVTPDGQTECPLPFCGLWAEAGNLFCRAHTTRWRQAGCPDTETFITACARRGQTPIDFRSLAPQAKLELQYALQCRRDEQATRTRPAIVTQAIGRVAAAGVDSVLDYPLPAGLGRRAAFEAFLGYAVGMLEVLREGAGWQAEYHRDVWRLDRLPGLAGAPTRAGYRLLFDRIIQPWLRELAKRLLRLRLSSGIAAGTAAAHLVALARFSQFLATTGVDGLAEVDRLLLERYLAWLATAPGGWAVKTRAVSVLDGLLTAIRQHGWDDTLPAGAMFFAGDHPRRPPAVGRHLAEQVMIQVEAPVNLDRWISPEGRLITVILIRCGLRASDACALAFDCLLHDGQGAPYLRYRNHKMNREAVVPIDAEVEAEIRTQQQRLLARWPAGSPHLFPRPTANTGGQRCLPYATYRLRLKHWLSTCDIRDEHGRPVDLTPHQWRHTFATRLINRDVPQEVVRVLLDHDSSAMTALYARITDQTVRRHWEQATKVNINGQRVTLDPDGPLAQAQWAKTRYGIATQTLPNGYCGLPVQKTSSPDRSSCPSCASSTAAPSPSSTPPAATGRPAWPR